MTNEEIYNKIENLYAGEKSKGFIVHLLRNFFPVNKTTIVFLRPQKDNKEVEMKCCITGQKLYSKDHALEIVLKDGDEIVKSRIDFLVASMNEKELPKFTEAEIKLKEIMLSLALTSETSDKFISREAFEQLYNFWASEMLKGNKHLNWVAKNQMISESVKNLEDKKIITPKEKHVIVKMVNKKSSLSLGDLDVLKDLKMKMETLDKEVSESTK